MDKSEFAAAIRAVAERAPLVHNLTNYVVMNFSADALLAIGASPVMAHAPEEVDDLVAMAQAVVVNIGTLSAPWVASMAQAMRTARSRHVPVILDPVGVGATAYRTRTARELIELCAPDVIRGNASEILALAGGEARTKGVDSQHASDEALAAARDLAARTRGVVCVSGAVDYITDGRETYAVMHGDAWMTRVTGMGCVATALIGAFRGAGLTPLRATIGAMAAMGVAAERARPTSRGPASFKIAFVDELYGLKEKPPTVLKVERRA